MTVLSLWWESPYLEKWSLYWDRIVEGHMVCMADLASHGPASVYDMILDMHKQWIMVVIPRTRFY